MISKYEQEYYRNRGRIADALEKIALCKKWSWENKTKKRYS